MPDHDMTYPQAPVMTQRHLDQLWQVCRLWPYPELADQNTLLEIHAHLTALLAQPVPSREHTLTPYEVAIPKELIRAANKTLLGIATPEEISLVESWNAIPVDVTPDFDALPPNAIVFEDCTVTLTTGNMPSWWKDYTPPTIEDDWQSDQ